MIIRSIITILVTTILLEANFEQKVLTINPEGRQLSITFYHFTSTVDVQITAVDQNLGAASQKLQSRASITADSALNLSYKSGKFKFPQASSYLIKNGSPITNTKSKRSTKRTFILTNNQNRHAICYAPVINEQQLSHAIQEYLKTSKYGYSSAVVVGEGNQSSFYKSNGKYRPYYLKELKKTQKAIFVK